MLGHRLIRSFSTSGKVHTSSVSQLRQSRRAPLRWYVNTLSPGFSLYIGSHWYWSSSLGSRLFLLEKVASICSAMHFGRYSQFMCKETIWTTQYEKCQRRERPCGNATSKQRPFGCIRRSVQSGRVGISQTIVREEIECLTTTQEFVRPDHTCEAVRACVYVLGGEPASHFPMAKIRIIAFLKPLAIKRNTK